MIEHTTRFNYHIIATIIPGAIILGFLVLWSLDWIPGWAAATAIALGSFALGSIFEDWRFWQHYQPDRTHTVTEFGGRVEREVVDSFVTRDRQHSQEANA